MSTTWTDPRLGMTERELQSHVERLAKDLRWLGYHTWRSDRSNPGFPDLILLRGARQLAVELKSQKGKPTTAQMIWLEAFAKIPGSESHLWRPEDLLDGTIAKVLR